MWPDTKQDVGRLHLFDLLWDDLTARRVARVKWVAEWPPDAEMVVSGDNIYAVTKTDASIYVRKVQLSRLKKR